MTCALDLSALGADELRQLASRLLEEMRGKQALIDKLTHEMAILKRLKFAASSEAYTGEQQRMLFETARRRYRGAHSRDRATQSDQAGRR